MANHKSTDKAIIDALFAKHNQGLSDYKRIYEDLVALYEQSRLNFLSLRDLHAAGRVFGLDLSLPDNNARNASQQYFLSPKARGERVAADARSPSSRIPGAAIASLPEPAEQLPMPRIRDIVLERLKEAGQNGTRAAPIRDHIKEKYAREIHEKTVGMTLYRLAKDKLAHRVGITWFFGPAPPETKNPGGETPGLKDLLS